MKLQYLGDYRDAFKWDLLHWLCSTADSEATSLLFVPLLTPDDPNPRDGQIPHNRFLARPEVQQFVASLKSTPRGLGAITDQGSLEPTKQFSVSIHTPDRYVEPGRRRPDYWWGIDHPSKSVVFLDPDNGFETKTCKGTKWVRHSEVKSLLENRQRSWFTNIAHVSSSGKPSLATSRSIFSTQATRRQPTTQVLLSSSLATQGQQCGAYPRRRSVTRTNIGPFSTNCLSIMVPNQQMQLTVA